jgi:hypothetical protein
MEFDQVFRREEESARLAVPCLFLPQRREAPRHTRVFAPSCRPIAPVAVVRARLPLHFDVSHHGDTRVLVAWWSVAVPESPAFAGRGVPIALDGPSPTLAGVPAKRPSSALLIQAVVEPMQGLRTAHRTRGIGPARNDRGEQADQVRWLSRLVRTDQRRPRCPVAFHRLLPWRDERFAAPSPRCVVLPRSILAHLEAQKIAACFALYFFKRVGDACLLLAPLQSDVLQPCWRPGATLCDNGSVPVEDNQIVRVSAYLRLPMELTAGWCRVSSRPGWEVRAANLFETVPCDVRQPRRRLSPYPELFTNPRNRPEKTLLEAR